MPPGGLAPRLGGAAALGGAYVATRLRCVGAVFGLLAHPCAPLELGLTPIAFAYEAFCEETASAPWYDHHFLHLYRATRPINYTKHDREIKYMADYYA